MRIYISSDYDGVNGDQNVVDVFGGWNTSKRHGLEFVDMAKVASGSVSKNNPNCRICDLKKEFNRQINASSTVIFVVGDMTKYRTAGSACGRAQDYSDCHKKCTPYKQNTNGEKECKFWLIPRPNPQEGVYYINGYSYLRHEFEQAKLKGKKIIIVYNSLNKQPSWLPSYMKGFEDKAIPFWKRSALGNKIGDYETIKKMLDE
jgi:hypothetical protein